MQAGRLRDCFERFQVAGATKLGRRRSLDRLMPTDSMNLTDAFNFSVTSDRTRTGRRSTRARTSRFWTAAMFTRSRHLSADARGCVRFRSRW
jgi:hypothetical protein